MSERALQGDATRNENEVNVDSKEASTSLERAEADKQGLQLEIEAERRRLADIFQYAPSFMAVLRGPQHVFERVNNRYLELVDGREVIGLPVREALPEIEGQGYFELLDHVYRTGKPHVRVDARVILGDAPVAKERILQFVYQPMLDAHGAVSGVIVQGVDMTEQRMTEANLARVTAESERLRRMYETVLSNTADFVYLFDTAGRFTYINKALLDLWGKDLSQAVGKNFFELDYPEDLAKRLHQQVLDVVHTGQPVRDETLYTNPSGTESYEYIFTPILGVDGCIEGVAGSTRQITERKRAEEALRQSEQRYRALATATFDVTYRMSADWVSMQPLDGRGFIASNTKPQYNWLEQNLPEFEHSRVTSAIQQAIAQKKAFELEHQVIRADGVLGWTFSRAIPILNDDGNIVEWFGTASDVTRRKQAEEELRDIRSRMEAALSAGAIGTWSWDVIADKFYGDGSLTTLFSAAPEDVSGGPLTRIIDAIHLDDRERVRALIKEAMATGNHYEASYRVAQSDGTWKWVTARGRVERNTNYNPLRFSGVVIDVTEWKRAEENLTRVTEESERRKRLYETILSNTPDLAYVFDLEHKFTYANEGLLKMWGRTWEEAIGKTCLELGYEPWHAEMHNREIDKIKSTRQSLRGEVPFEGTFGRRIYDYILVPVFGSDGEVEAVAGTTRDVTERKEAEETLRDADRKKDDFIALLAHELRNPLAPIRTGLQVIRLVDSQGVIAEAREMMERQLGHMIRMIDDLLDVSRISRNKMELRRARVSIAEVIASAIETAQPLIDEAKHEFVILMPEQDILLDADLTRLSQVFSNLLTNSAKYTEPGGIIWLTGAPVEGGVVISVKDTGYGIPSDSLPTIFGMFSQVNRSIERSAGGLGIGLALVKGLVEMHGGTVTAKSDGLGLGSEFTVRLPTIDRPSSAVSADNVSHVRPSSLTNRRILVVDDNMDAAKSMAQMLKLIGNEVMTAHDGIDAVEKAEKFRPDLMLMDVGMPRLNGLEATHQIRKETWGKSVTIVALTGWGQETDRERSRQAGCNGHLTKPVDMNSLADLLQRLREQDSLRC